MFDGITRIAARAHFQPKVRRRAVQEVEATRPRPEESEERNRDEEEGPDRRPVGRRVDLSL